MIKLNRIFISVANWWLRLSTRMKVATILVFIFFLLFLYKSVRYSLIKYRYFKEKEKQVEIYKDSLKVSQRRVNLLLNSAKEENQRVIKRSKKIDKKLQDDKKKIYNTPVTDDDLNTLISKYEKRAKDIQNQ